MHKVHIGTMGWSYPFWRENFYPKDLPQKEFLGYYAKQFDAVEVDSTFYRIPSALTVENWQRQTGANFVFSIKFPRIITHIKMLKNCQEETQFFLKRVGLLEEKLGPLLLQFPPAFGEANLQVLEEFLKELPKKHRYAVEVRNRKLLNENLYSILRNNNVTLAWVENQRMPVNDNVTSDFLYIRWEGNRAKVSGNLGKREVDRSVELKSWAKKLKLLSASKYEIFGFFSKYFSGDPPSDVYEFLEFITAARFAQD